MDGNTAMYRAVVESLAKNRAIVLLSDGMNTDPKCDFTQLCRQLQEQPVPVYAIGLGWEDQVHA